MSKQKLNRKANKKVIIQSLLTLIFLALAIFISWWFIAPVALLIWLNQKELFKNN
jgi:hypothetical protein